MTPDKCPHQEIISSTSDVGWSLSWQCRHCGLHGKIDIKSLQAGRRYSQRDLIMQAVKAAERDWFIQQLES